MSVTPRLNKDGTVTWRVSYRVDGASRTDSFGDPSLTSSENEKAARFYSELVNRLGGKYAREILQKRRNPPTED